MKIQNMLKIKNSKDKTIWKIQSSLNAGYDVSLVENMFDPNNLTLLSYGNQSKNQLVRRIVFVDDFINLELENKIKHYFKANNVEYKLVKIFCSEERN